MKLQIIKKISFISSIFLGMLFFFGYLKYQSCFYKVIKINSPTEIIIDLNNNGSIEKEETIKLSKITIPENFSEIKNYSELENFKEEFLYLATEFANNNLKNQTVTLKKSNNEYEIFIKGQSYNKILADSGFIFENGTSSAPEKTLELLEKIKKDNYRIYNQYSNKYHTLTCKYGKSSADKKILPLNQIPNNAQPCRYCKASITNNEIFTNPNLTKPKYIFENKFLKIILSDNDNIIKPSNNCDNYFCKELISQINNTHSTIDLALYGIEKFYPINTALINAQNRGVKIRMIYDLDYKNENYYNGTLELANLIKTSKSDVNQNSKSNHTMHNKFIIFDNKTVMSGSANISKTDLSNYNLNNIIFINSEKIAQIYKEEFEQMYNGKFHNYKSIIQEKTNLKIKDTEISIYFSPMDKQLTTQIIPLINKSKSTILMPVFLLTEKNLTQALINAHNRGVKIKVIIDAGNASSKHSKHELLRQAGIPVKTENFGGKLHSKTLIIDNKYTILGSMNFSYSGENKNDENTLIIDNPAIATFYSNYFNYLWQKIPNMWLKYNARAESKDSKYSCNDGIDNDFDGYIDKQDPLCQ